MSDIRDEREPTRCPRCGVLCTYDGWDHVHPSGIGIGSCSVDVPQEWVEKAAQALDPRAWQSDNPAWQRGARKSARTALAAVLPDVRRAALKDAAAVFTWEADHMRGSQTEKILRKVVVALHEQAADPDAARGLR